MALDQLSQAPAALAAWLANVPPSLRDAVRLRVEGERVALPGPALTPYLVGLLVMLGMLGTFLGMVVTFQGAVFAMQGSTDLQAVRSALAEPIKGLGLSFGTSVATPATEVPNDRPRPRIGSASAARIACRSVDPSSANTAPLKVTTMPRKVPSMPSITSSPTR